CAGRGVLRAADRRVLRAGVRDPRRDLRIAVLPDDGAGAGPRDRRRGVPGHGDPAGGVRRAGPSARPRRGRGRVLVLRRRPGHRAVRGLLPGGDPVKVFSRIGLIFGGAFVVDAIVYWITQNNEQGLSLLAMTAAGFAYMGIYAALALRKAGREAAAEAGEEEEPHIGPAIWPAVFAVAAVGLTFGILVAP